MTEYPEHEKLAKVESMSQPAGEFLEYLLHQRCFQLCTLNDRDELIPTYARDQELLADWLGIDQRAIDREKEEMLATQRRLNVGTAASRQEKRARLVAERVQEAIRGAAKSRLSFNCQADVHAGMPDGCANDGQSCLCECHDPKDELLP